MQNTETQGATTDRRETRKPAHTVRRGAIAANIWRRHTKAGAEYFDFSVSRAWKSEASGKQGYSANFFARNEPELLEVIQEASEWIALQEDSAQATTKELNGNLPARDAATNQVPETEAES